MSLVGDWQELERSLPEGWGNARLRLTIPDEGECDRAAALLGPANPGRRGKVIRFFTARRGAGPSSDTIRNLLRRIDAQGIEGELELVGVDEAEADPVIHRETLAATWDAAIGALPPDWSDLYAELELVSSDWLERAALLMAPLNPARYGGLPGFRFRVARRFGYGASAEMTRRCLERVDQEHIRGEFRILRVLSNTDPVHTQGPVWYVEGRSV
jgi:hypothetical protein